MTSDELLDLMTEYLGRPVKNLSVWTSEDGERRVYVTCVGESSSTMLFSDTRPEQINAFRAHQLFKALELCRQLTCHESKLYVSRSRSLKRLKVLANEKYFRLFSTNKCIKTEAVAIHFDQRRREPYLLLVSGEAYRVEKRGTDGSVSVSYGILKGGKWVKTDCKGAHANAATEAHEELKRLIQESQRDKRRDSDG